MPNDNENLVFTLLWSRSFPCSSGLRVKVLGTGGWVGGCFVGGTRLVAISGRVLGTEGAGVRDCFEDEDVKRQD